VYIQEAHPTDGWQVTMNLDQEVLYAQPRSPDERAQVAEACVLHLNFEMPMLLDDMKNAVDQAYCALPERLYVLDRAGRIAWRCGMGPFGFDPDGWENAIRAQI
jgi:type I thyroxine 5'-deiodinase